jgi:hypothetical protein
MLFNSARRGCRRFRTHRESQVDGGATGRRLSADLGDAVENSDGAVEFSWRVQQQWKRDSKRAVTLKTKRI